MALRSPEMTLPFALPPLVTPSIVGFAEASLLAPEVAGAIQLRLADAADGPAIEHLLDEVAPLILKAVEVANSLHFRFDIVEVALEPSTMLLVEQQSLSIDGLNALHPDRKLIVMLPLVGEASISFPSIAKDRRLAAGTVAIFPAFLANEVVPDEEFVALVGYAIGPSFV